MREQRMRCYRGKTGWYCQRSAGHVSSCALIPRWWNLKYRKYRNA